MRILPRWCHKFYAWFAGYFWYPCPICGEPFGGHEYRPGSTSLWFAQGRGNVVCPKPACSVEAARRNRAAGFNMEWTEFK